MKIDQTDPLLAKIEIETDEGYQTFKAGLENRNNWMRHPETVELSTFVRDKRKSAQIAVNFRDTWTRIK